MTDSQALQNDMERAIADVLTKHGELPTKWVLAVESLGPDGQNGIWCLTSAQITAWDALGLLEYTRHAELASIQSTPAD